MSRTDRMAYLLAQQGNRCVWCGARFERLRRPTVDHLVPRVKAGPSWLENEVAACVRCNRTRGHITPAEWLNQCELLGQEPQRQFVESQLQACRERIALDGGQRRAAAYLDNQLRRVARRTRWASLPVGAEGLEPPTSGL